MNYNKQKEIFDTESLTWDLKSDITNEPERVVKLSKINKNMRVLDVGCGTGIMEQSILYAIGQKGFIKAIDISTGMLAKAKEKFKEPNIIFEENNIETIKDSSEYYDVIICNNVFPHFVNPKKVLNNCHRLLKKGGILTVSHLKGRNFVNNIHKDTEHFKQEEKVPKAQVWSDFFKTFGFNEVITLDEENFYIIVMEKI